MTTNNHEISLQQAIDMTARYRANRPSNAPLSETFEAGVINRLLGTPGCCFFRVYYGMDEDMQVHAIFVAADKDNADILPAQNSLETSNNNPTIVEDGIRCPPACPPSSPLNT